MTAATSDYNMIPVSISAEAAREIRMLLDKKNVPAGYFLRIAVQGGGCGVTPTLGFDLPADDDLTYEISGISVAIKRKHLMFLAGRHVEFYNGEDRRGFYFTQSGTEPG